jgi:hypothetical protein
MRRAFAAVSAVAVILALAVPAATAAPSPAKLAAQIRTLQKQVKTLQKKVKKMNTVLGQTETIAVVALLYGGCNSAATADALQGGNAAMYGTTSVPDYNTCSDLGRFTGTTIARAPNQPTVNVFQQMLNIFKP